MKLAYIIGTYPVLTTTFIDREIQLLRARGVELQVIAIRRPKSAISSEQGKLQKDVIYLLPLNVLSFLAGQFYFAFHKPAVFFRLLFSLVRQPHPDLKSVWMTALHFFEGVHAAQRNSFASNGSAAYPCPFCRPGGYCGARRQPPVGDHLQPDCPCSRYLCQTHPFAREDEFSQFCSYLHIL